MNNRVALLVCLDTAMLLLVCVLEPIKFTGLEWHEWLGFALCPLVLLHVVLQWQWFIMQFRAVARPGGPRVRVSAVLNLLLFVLMAAVLFSGVFVSRQSTALIGESAGRVRLWSEVHGWLNFVLVLFVGLHLALNWDWILAALRRRRPRSPGSDVIAAGGRPPALMKHLGRACVLLLAGVLAAGAAYFVLKATLPPRKLADLRNHPAITATAEYSQKKKLAPGRRSAHVSDGLWEFGGILSLTLFVAIAGRYVFRLRL